MMNNVKQSGCVYLEKNSKGSGISLSDVTLTLTAMKSFNISSGFSSITLLNRRRMKVTRVGFGIIKTLKLGENTSTSSAWMKRRIDAIIRMYLEKNVY